MKERDPRANATWMKSRLDKLHKSDYPFKNIYQSQRVLWKIIRNDGFHIKLPTQTLIITVKKFKINLEKLTIWQRELRIIAGNTSLIIELKMPLIAVELRVSSRSIFSLIIRCIPCYIYCYGPGRFNLRSLLKPAYVAFNGSNVKNVHVKNREF